MNVRIRWAAGALAAIALIWPAGSPASAAAEPGEPSRPVNLMLLEDGDQLYGKIWPFVTTALEMNEDDASELSAEAFYEVDLGRYPEGCTREFIAFVQNEDWIELVLVAANEDGSEIKLLDRASSSERGDLFLNRAKVDFTTHGNRIRIWTQAPYRAYESNAELEWSGKRFFVVSHAYGDPTERYFDRKSQRLKARNLEGLIDLYEEHSPQYPASYEKMFELAAPTLKLAHEEAQRMRKSDLQTAIRYLDYGLKQYGDAFGIWGYAEGKLESGDIVPPSADSPRAKLRIGLAAYVGMLHDYGYFLSLDGRNEEAKLVLDNVIRLVPERAIAYLHLADAEWALGLSEDSKAHYEQYLELLGDEASLTAPRRVQERIEAK
ncbi:hypothetical protein ACF3MZ_18735 [Paenibacillaceae bacterium WGS1546]|uniref:hypothetical protein n=1 Tax=Cohnella sp. WGS1546 TaxID=3366810 RepID=UPI00372D3C27